MASNDDNFEVWDATFLTFEKNHLNSSAVDKKLFISGNNPRREIYDENFPINMMEWVYLSGEGPSSTILSANQGSSVINFINIENSGLYNLAVTNGRNYTGAGIYALNSTVDIDNCDISNNECIVAPNGQQGTTGAGIYFSSYPEDRLLSINNSKIFSNTVGGGDDVQKIGGGIFTENSLLINNTLIYENEAGNGAGIYSLARYNDGEITQINNSQIYSNDAYQGSAFYGFNINLYNSNVFNNYSSLTYETTIIDVREHAEILNSTVAYNTSSWVMWFASCCSDDWAFGDAIIANSIFWNEESDYQIVAGYDTIQPIDRVVISYSIIKGGETDGVLQLSESNSEEYYLDGNLDLDPLFELGPGGIPYTDFSLSDTSPCIDAGTIDFSWDNNILLNMSPRTKSAQSVDSYSKLPMSGAHPLYSSEDIFNKILLSHEKSIVPASIHGEVSESEKSV
jgi:hypothetical protein